MNYKNILLKILKLEERKDVLWAFKGVKGLSKEFRVLVCKPCFLKDEPLEQDIKVDIKNNFFIAVKQSRYYTYDIKIIGLLSARLCCVCGDLINIIDEYSGYGWYNNAVMRFINKEIYNKENRSDLHCKFASLVIGNWGESECMKFIKSLAPDLPVGLL